MQSVVRCFMCIENKSHVLSTRFHCGYWVTLHYTFTIYLLTRKWKLLIFWHNSSSITAVPLWSKSFIIAIVFCWPFAFLTSLFELQQLIPHLSLLMSVCHLADFSIDFTAWLHQKLSNLWHYHFSWIQEAYLLYMEEAWCQNVLLCDLSRHSGA